MPIWQTGLTPFRVGSIRHGVCLHQVMPRQLRPDFTDLPVHVMNRAARGLTLFENDFDYAAFERVLVEALTRVPIRVLAFCEMPNHFHFVLWPRSTEELSRFMKTLTQVHAMRWHQARESVGAGAVGVLQTRGRDGLHVTRRR